jgi:hypothetical protein
MPEMSVHVSEAHDLVAEMAFGCSTAVCELVWCKTGKEEFSICGLIRISLLWDLQMTETAKNELARTRRGFVMCKCWY